MKWCFYSLAISLSHFWRIILAVGKCILFVPRIHRSGGGLVTHSHIAKFVPRVEFVSSCQNFLPRATHRPLPLTELNTACFRESPPADFGKVPRSVNPVILCHWHNELNTSKYHFQKQNHRQQPSGLTLWHWQCLTHLKHKYYRLQAISGQLQGVFF